MAEYKRVDRKLEFEGRIVKFYSDTIELPDGQTAVWDFIEHKGAAAIVPVNKDGDLVMVRQYRNAPEQYTLEIPAGGLNAGEDMQTCAARELEEETGFKAGKVEHLLDLYTTVAFCNEKIGIYYTEELTPSKQHLDEGEYLNVEVHSLESLVEMILAGKIIDAKTIAAILAYKAKAGR
ncbi:MAG: NUDIX hydrolase [Lachnospiraceae bacterium]|nr:NUDIX hydrolase [Lachnospiraceae bacterium]